MARIELLCPMCGEELTVKTKVASVMPGEVVLAIAVAPCDAWCTILRGDDGDR